jgi:hypothetical protein
VREAGEGILNDGGNNKAKMPFADEVRDGTCHRQPISHTALEGSRVSFRETVPFFFFGMGSWFRLAIGLQAYRAMRDAKSQRPKRCDSLAVPWERWWCCRPWANEGW